MLCPNEYKKCKFLNMFKSDPKYSNSVNIDNLLDVNAAREQKPRFSKLCRVTGILSR